MTALNLEMLHGGNYPVDESSVVHEWTPVDGKIVSDSAYDGESDSTNRISNTTLKLDTLERYNNPADQSSVVDELASVHEKIVFDTKCDEGVPDTEYAGVVSADDEYEIDEEILIDEETLTVTVINKETVIDEKTAIDEETVIDDEKVIVEEEEVTEIQEEITEIEEEVEEGVITENEEDNDSDGMSDYSSVGEYDPDQPILVNPPDHKPLDQPLEYQQLPSIEAAREEARKRSKARAKKEEENRERARSLESARRAQEEARKEQAEILRQVRESIQQEAEDEAFRSLGFDLFEETSSEQKDKQAYRRSTSMSGLESVSRARSSSSKRRSSKRNSGSKKSSSSKRSSLAKSRSTSGSRRNLGKVDEKKKKNRPKRSVSLNEMELGAVIADDIESSAMAELSALEAELNKNISLFTMNNSKRPDPPATGDVNAKARTGLGPRMKSMSDLEPDNRQVKTRPRLGRKSKSKIYLLDGLDGGRRRKRSSPTTRRSMNDIEEIASVLKSSSTSNATWDKTPESAKTPIRTSNLLDAILSGDKQKRRESDISGRTENTTKTASMQSSRLNFAGSIVKYSPGSDLDCIVTPSRAPRRSLGARSSSISKIMSYSSFVDDGSLDDSSDDEIYEVTPQPRKSRLSAIIARSPKYETMDNDAVSPGSRRQSLMQMGGLLKHSMSARNLGSDGVLDGDTPAPGSRRRTMKPMGGLLKYSMSARNLGSDGVLDGDTPTPVSRRRTMKPMSSKHTMSARNLGSEGVLHDDALTSGSRRQKMKQMSGKHSMSARNLGSNEIMDDDALTPGSRRQKMKQMGGRLRHSARNLGL